MRGRNWSGIFRYRSNQEPMVADPVVVVGIWDFLHRHERRRACILCRLWLQDDIQSGCGLNGFVFSPHRSQACGCRRVSQCKKSLMAHRDRFCAATECPLLGVKRPSLERARNVEIALYGLAVGPAECSPRLPAQWPGMVSMRAGDRPAHATEALPRAPVRLPGLFFAASNFRQPLAPFRFPDRDQVRDRGIPDRLLLAGKLSAKCG